MDWIIGAFILFIVIVALIAIAGSAFWIWMLIDCGANKRISDSQRVGWLLLIIFTHLLGAIIYFFAARNPSTPPIAYQQPYIPSQANMPPQDVYRSYQQGYQGQKAPSPSPHPSEAFHWDEPSQQEQALLEQPQASYPPAPQE